MRWRAQQELTVVKKPAFTREQLKEYAKVSGDGNLIHLDDSVAKQMGFPSVIVHGMLSMAYLADSLLVSFPEKEYRILRLSTRFRRVAFPGDALSCGGKIKKVSDSGELVVSLWAKNQRDEIVADGEADVKPIALVNA